MMYVICCPCILYYITYAHWIFPYFCCRFNSQFSLIPPSVTRCVDIHLLYNTLLLLPLPISLSPLNWSNMLKYRRHGNFFIPEIKRLPPISFLNKKKKIFKWRWIINKEKKMRNGGGDDHRQQSMWQRTWWKRATIKAHHNEIDRFIIDV